MEIIIKTLINVKTNNVDLLNNLKNKLTVKNPQYYKMQQMGQPIFDVPKYYEMYEIVKDGILIPRGCGILLKQLAKLYNDKITKFTDNRSDGHEIDIEVNYKDNFKILHSYQQRMIDTIHNNNHVNGVIVMPCGAGKTVAALGLIASFKTSTLILVHTKDLLEQWKDEIKGCANKDIKPKLEGDFTLGQLGAGTKQIGDITIGMVQTLHNLKDVDFDFLSRQFGLVIEDECFHYDTLIQTNCGLKKIGDLHKFNKKYKALSYNFDTNELRYKNILNTYKHKRKTKIYKVTLEDDEGKIRTLLVTENHKFPDINGNYKELNQFKENDYLLSIELDNKIKYLHHVCTKCGKIINGSSAKGGHTMHCSNPARSKQQSRDRYKKYLEMSKEYRKEVHSKAMKTRSENMEYKKYLSDRIKGDKNPSKRPEVKIKIKKTIKDKIKNGSFIPYSRKKFYEYTKHELMFQEIHPKFEHEKVFPVGKGNRKKYIAYWFKADFVDEINKVIYEIDSQIHNNIIIKERDTRKTKFFNDNNYKVIRYTNKEVESMYAEFKKM